jgi:hypothetical protein
MTTDDDDGAGPDEFAADSERLWNLTRDVLVSALQGITGASADVPSEYLVGFICGQHLPLHELEIVISHLDDAALDKERRDFWRETFGTADGAIYEAARDAALAARIPLPPPGTLRGISSCCSWLCAPDGPRAVD